MKMYASIYHFYRTALIRTIRLFVFSLLLFVFLSHLANQSSLAQVQFFFNIFLMIEIFFHYKICRVIPSKTVTDNTSDVLQSFTLSVLADFMASHTTKTFIRASLKTEQVQMFFQKINLTKEEFTNAEKNVPEITKQDLAKKAFEVAKTYRGIYVTRLDIVLAYLLLTESQTKLFFNENIKSDDIQNIMVWLRKEFAKEEKQQKNRVTFAGSGIGEAFVSGWTYETKKYTTNFTDSSLAQEPVILGREREFRAMLEGLVKMQNNNVLVVGDIGAGKENLVRALAYYSFEGKLGASLDHRHIYQLLVGPLTAGISSRSDLEVRLQNIIAEISHANDVILYIPDFQNVVGGTSYNLDISGALLPYLKAGSMPVIATMTTGSYKTYMEKNPLKEAFSVVTLQTPEKQLTLQMVLAMINKIEKSYRVIISYQAIESAVDLAERFLQDESLPGSAVSLLEAVANMVSLSNERPFDKTGKKIILAAHVIKQVEETTHIAIGTPNADETNLLLHLEEKLHERVIDQDEAIVAIAEAMRRVRSGVKTAERPISFLFLGPTGVGKTETAKALAELYYEGEKHMVRLDMSEYTDETGLRRLLGAPPGEGNERGELTEKIHDNPSSLILLDEFEKAHPQIHNLFLQVLDDGRLTDNKGVTVSFRNCIIIATSNAGSEFIREEVQKGLAIDKVFHQKLLDYLQEKAIFRPELLNRFDDVVTFKPLGNAVLTQVIKLLLQSLSKTLAEQDITLVVNENVIAKIAKEGFDPDFGARPMRRYIQDNLEDMIAQKKLTNELKRGNTATFSVDQTDNLQLTIS